MFITLIREKPTTRRVFTVAVEEDYADDVIEAMTTTGWRVLKKVYWPDQPIIDSLQVALLEVSALPVRAPVRVAVEHSASAALFSMPSMARRSPQMGRGQ